MAFLPAPQIFKTLTPKIINDKGELVNNELLYAVFDEIIKGELRPDRYGDDDENRGGIVFIDYYICDDEYMDSELSYTEYISGEDESWYEEKEKRKLNEILKLIPIPPNNKSLKYVILLAREVADIKNSIKLFIDLFNPQVSDAKVLKSFARKNIAMLKTRAEELRIYSETLSGEEKDTNHYIVHVLKVCNVNIIQFIQKIFSLKRYDQVELFKDLFNEKPKFNDDAEFLKTFKTKFTTLELKEIHKNLIKEKFIQDIKEDEFLYLFSEQPVTLKMVLLKFIETNELCIGFLDRIVYLNEKERFSFIRANKCIITKDEIPLHGNQRIKKEDPRIDKNNRILNRVFTV